MPFGRINKIWQLEIFSSFFLSLFSEYVYKVLLCIFLSFYGTPPFTLKVTTMHLLIKIKQQVFYFKAFTFLWRLIKYFKYIQKYFFLFRFSENEREKKNSGSRKFIHYFSKKIRLEQWYFLQKNPKFRHRRIKCKLRNKIGMGYKVMHSDVN